MEEQPSETSMEQCFLLELPAELRNEIFGLALYHPKGLVIDCLSKMPNAQNPLALTATCKQIWQECSGLLYAQHELVLYMPIAKCPTGRLAAMVGYSRMLFDIGVCEKFKGIRMSMGRINVYDFVATADWGWYAFTSLTSECRARQLPFCWSFQLSREVAYDVRITKTRSATGVGFHCAVTCSGSLPHFPYGLHGFHVDFARWVRGLFEAHEATVVIERT
jgi:hypothetical protein